MGNKVVYNTFPWPTVTTNQRKEIERLAEEVELAREDYPGKTLAELYDPDNMPAGLLEAHQALDSAVDKLYQDRPFKDAADRVSHLPESMKSSPLLPCYPLDNFDKDSSMENILQ